MSDIINVLDHGFARLIDSMGNDLSVSRAARVSYDAAWRAGEDQGSDTRLINYLWKNHHTSPFESVTFTFEVKAPSSFSGSGTGTEHGASTSFPPAIRSCPKNTICRALN